MEDNVTSDAVKDHPAGTGRNGKRVIVGVAAAEAVVLDVGGECGYSAWEEQRDSVARGACGSAVAAQKKAVDSYRTLLGADATTAALKTDVKAVKDAKTLDALKRAVGAETPAMVKCDASDKTGFYEATAKADKTVTDADGLYRATEGKVQDDKTRDALKQAIAKRDADAIAKAVKAVNDSKTAKDQADAEATAKAQAGQEAAAQAAAAQQAQQQAQRSYSYGSYSSGGWSGSAGGRSYSGGSYSGGSQGQGGGSPSGNSPAPSIHYDWEDKVTINPNCDGQHFCPLG